MQIIQTEDLVKGHTTEGDYYSPKGELLISKGETLTTQHIEILHRRNIYDIHIQDTPLPSATEGQHEPISAEPTHPPIAEQQKLPSPINWHILEGEQGFEQLLANRSVSNLDHAMKFDRTSDQPIGRAMKITMQQNVLFNRPDIYKKELFAVYEKALENIKMILSKLAHGDRVDAGSVRAQVEQFITYFLNDRNILLAIAAQKEDKDDPLFNHVLNVCLLAMNIAAAASFSEEQVILIGMGALLHDVGMLLVPPRIRFKQGRLSEEEWYEVRKHPLLGIHVLDRLMRLPDAVKFITYQTHERENGRGYPKQRSSRLIHNFAKIAQVADVFEAVSSPRSYRQAVAPYKGMEMLILMGKQGLLSETYVKTMLSSVSLFPVGSLVELSDGKIAQVIAANESRFSRPIVSIVAERDLKMIKQPHVKTLDLAHESNLQVIRSLPFDFMPCEVLHGF